MQPKRAPKPALRRPHQIKPFVFLRAIDSVIEHLGCIFETALAQSNVAQTCARGCAKASRLAQLCDHRQRPTARIESVLKMFACGFEIVVGESDAAGAQLVSHVNNRDAILIEFFLRLE